MFSVVVQTLLFVAFVFNLILGSLMLFRKKEEANILFSIVNFSLGLWALAILLYWFSKNPNVALFYSKCAYTFAGLIPIILLRFSLVFPYRDKIIVKYPQLNLIFLVVFAIWGLTWNNLIVSGVEKVSWGYNLIPAKHYLTYIIYFTVYMTLSFIVLFLKYRKSAGVEKIQTLHVFTGCIVCTILGSIPNLIMPFLGVTKYTSTGPLATFILIVFISYAIVKHRLMDITVTITHTTIFVVLYTLVLGLPFLLEAQGKVWLVALLGDSWLRGPLILMATLAVAGPFIYIYLQKRAEAIILREQRAYQETLKKASLGMTRFRNLQELLDLIVNVIVENVAVAHSAIYVLGSKEEKFDLKVSHNFKKTKRGVLEQKSNLINWLNDNKKPLIYEEINRLAEKDNSNKFFKKLLKELNALKASIVIPGFLEDKLFNVIILGDKISGKIYTTEDLNIFSVLAGQAALAIENAVLYENIEEKVRQRTEELVEVQSQLVQAEKLATVGTLAGGVAHEINNPLTAILTNTQMLLDSDELDAEDKESLELVEEATKRCRAIVKKLMVYARKPLEEGKLVKIDLSEIINNVVDFLKYQLEQENINLVLEKVDKDCFISANKNEIEQVITNIILNGKDAIQRVKKSGSVTLRVFNDKDNIRFEIEDQGQGIPDDALSKIFDPFFTTKDVGKGLGLGLSICQGIVEKHGGRISANNVLNKKGNISGAVFIVELPIAKDK